MSPATVPILLILAVLVFWLPAPLFVVPFVGIVLIGALWLSHGLDNRREP